MLKKLSVIALSAGVVFSGMGIASADMERPNPAERVKEMGKGKGKVENVIFMIPDGFSADYAANYRVYKGEDAVWDDHLKGLFTTNSANSDITDSAAAATAMATGVKTNNGVIGFDPTGKDLQTILEASEKKGKSSGLVATSTITHATPAGFAVSVENRNNETEIARQYIEGEVDVLLGGGKNIFLPKSDGGKQEKLNLVDEAQKKGFEYVESRDQLLNVSDVKVEKGEKLLGLFAGEGMTPELHRGETEEPSLAEMTETAIEVLDKDKDGFFLMVEGSQIDWAGHDNDAAWAMSDTEAFEAAVAKAIDFAKKDGKTLVVIAGDHDTGGMTTGANGSMDLNADVLKDVTATGDYMAAQLNKDRSNVANVVSTYTGMSLSDQEVQYIQHAKDPSLAINKVVSDRAFVGWTSYNHTGADIPVYAFGPQSDKFVGFHDNTDLPKILAEVLKLKLNN